MILTIHALVGTTAAGLFPGNPAGAFLSGLASHYLIDRIPHYEYELASKSLDTESEAKVCLELNRHLALDFLKIGLDFSVGIFLSWLLFHNTLPLPIIFLGILGGVLPDFGQFLYLVLRCFPFNKIHKIHRFFHSPVALEQKKWLGYFSQFIVLFFILAVYLYLNP